MSVLSTEQTPSRPGDLATAPGVGGDSSPVDHRFRILVVDDSPASRAHIVEALRRLPDAETAIAESGTQALRALKQGGYCMVLCDYEMPDMSGLQVLRFVRTLHSALQLPVLMLTSREEAEVKVRAFRAGANDYIPKRAEPEELVARVATQIELLKAHRRAAAASARAAEAKRFEAVGHLAEALAHELNTPAQYIGDNLSFLAESFDELHQLIAALRALEGNVPAEQIRAAIDAADCDYMIETVPSSIAVSREGIERVSQIVAVMREFGRGGTRTPELHDLNEIVRGALAVSHGQWHNVVTLSLDLAPELPKVTCVGASIKQVMLRTILQVVKTMRHSEGETYCKKLEIRTREEPAGWAAIEIADWGPKLSSTAALDNPSNLSNLDLPLETTLSDERAQALAFARAIVVEDHAGRLEMIDRTATQTSVVLRLPMTR